MADLIVAEEEVELWRLYELSERCRLPRLHIAKLHEDGVQCHSNFGNLDKIHLI